MQFSEHEHGKRSGNSKVMKLDKLAKLLDVLIHIDGLPYGSNKTKSVVENLTSSESKDQPAEDVDDTSVDENIEAEIDGNLEEPVNPVLETVEVKVDIEEIPTKEVPPKPAKKPPVKKTK